MGPLFIFTFIGGLIAIPLIVLGFLASTTVHYFVWGRWLRVKYDRDVNNSQAPAAPRD